MPSRGPSTQFCWRFGSPMPFQSSGPKDGMPVQFGDLYESLETSLAPHVGGWAAFLAGRATRSVLWNGIGDPNLQQNWVEGPRLGMDRTSPAAMGGRSGTSLRTWTAAASAPTSASGACAAPASRRARGGPATIPLRSWPRRVRAAN